MGEEIKVTIKAEVADLRKKLEQSGVSASEARKLFNQLNKTLKDNAKAQSELAKAARATGDAQKQAAQRAQELQDQFGGLGDVATVLGLGPLATLADVGEALVRGFKDLGTYARLAAGVAGIGAVTVAAMVAGAAILKTTQAAQQYAEELKAFRGQQGFGVSPETIQQLESANAAFDAIVTIGKQAVVVLGAEFAPTVEEAGTRLVAFGLMGLDAFEQFAKGKDILHELAVFLVDNLVQALLGPASALANLAGLAGKLADAVGMEGLGAALQGVNSSWDGFTRGVAETTVSYYANSDALRDAATASDTYMARARALIGVQAQVNKGASDGAAALKQLSDAYQQSADAAAQAAADYQKGLGGLIETADRAALSRLEGEARVTAELRAQLDAIDAQERALLTLAQTDSARETVAAEAARARAETTLAAEEEIAEVRRRAAEEQARQQEEAARRAAELQAAQLAQATALASAVGQAAGQLAGALDSSYQNAANNANLLTAKLAAGEQYYTEAQEKELKRRIAAQEKAARKAFETAKEAKTTEAEIGAGLAFVNALAANPTPFGMAQAFGALALAQAQVGAMAAQTPAFHSGGLAEDEYTAKMRRGEAVLNPTGRRQVGDDQIRDANAGVTPAAERPLVIVQQYRHRIFNNFIRDNLAQGGPLAQRINQGRKVGHRATRRAA